MMRKSYLTLQWVFKNTLHPTGSPNWLIDKTLLSSQQSERLG